LVAEAGNGYRPAVKSHEGDLRRRLVQEFYGLVGAGDTGFEQLGTPGDEDSKGGQRD